MYHVASSLLVNFPQLHLHNQFFHRQACELLLCFFPLNQQYLEFGLVEGWLLQLSEIIRDKKYKVVS